MGTTTYADLLNYRRAVSDLYATVRHSTLPLPAQSTAFRAGRDHLFATHPQSGLTADQKATFAGLAYYPYDPAWRFTAAIEPTVDPAMIPVATQHDGVVRLQRFGNVHFSVVGEAVSLSLFWILGYGGGLFLPFRDQTNGQTTYGGGRYLLDTIKHADLGQSATGELILDFNYAYNPSCAYSAQWSCPLAPAENWLALAIPAGEQLYPGQMDPN